MFIELFRFFLLSLSLSNLFELEFSNLFFLHQLSIVFYLQSLLIFLILSYLIHHHLIILLFFIFNLILLLLLLPHLLIQYAFSLFLLLYFSLSCCKNVFIMHQLAILINFSPFVIITEFALNTSIFLFFCCFLSFYLKVWLSKGRQLLVIQHFIKFNVTLDFLSLRKLCVKITSRSICLDLNIYL